MQAHDTAMSGTLRYSVHGWLKFQYGAMDSKMSKRTMELGTRLVQLLQSTRVHRIVRNHRLEGPRSTAVHGLAVAAVLEQAAVDVGLLLTREENVRVNTALTTIGRDIVVIKLGVLDPGEVPADE